MRSTRLRFARLPLVAVVTLLGTFQASVAQADIAMPWGHAAWTQTANSCASDPSCNTTSSWSWHNARDNNTSSVWSSYVRTSSTATEWIAFWWSTGAQTTNYVTYVPRIVSGNSVHVPEELEIYKYVTVPSPAWVHVKTVALPALIHPSGYTVFLDSPVQTQGLLLQTSKMRSDGSGNYYFQIAELYAGDGQNLTNSPATKTWAPRSGVSCEVFGYSKTLALASGSTQLAYDFNVTKLSSTPGSTQFAAVFHSEPYKDNSSLDQVGDASSVIYSSSMDSFTRSGDDYVVTRTYHNPSNLSTFMYSYEAGGTTELNRTHSGGGNPILLRTDAAAGVAGWALYYLSVKNVNPSTEAEYSTGYVNPWSHFLHVSQPFSVANMKGGEWYTLARNLSSSTDYWAYTATHPKYLATDYWGAKFEPWPVRDWGTGGLLKSEYAPTPTSSTAIAETNGLIGNMSYNSAQSQIYFFYNDLVSGNYVTKRRPMHKSGSTFYSNWWDSSETVLHNAWAKMSFYNEVAKWAVFAACLVDTGYGFHVVDVCMDLSVGSSDTIANEFCPSSGSTCHTDMNGSSRRLGLLPYFDSAVYTGMHPNRVRQDGGVMEQFGISKTPEGQIQTDGNGYFRLYIQERTATDIWGGPIWSIKAKCSN